MALIRGDLLIELVTERFEKTHHENPIIHHNMGRLGFLIMHLTFKKHFKNSYWSIVDLQCCVSLRCTAK